MAASTVLTAYCNWLDASGVHYPKVAIRYIDDMQGYGLFAKEAIAKNEAVMNIPESIVMDTESIRKIAPFDTLFKEDQKLKPNDELALFAAMERTNPESPFKHYFDMIFNRGNLIPLLTYTKKDIEDLPIVMQPLWLVEQGHVEESYALAKELCPKLTKTNFHESFNSVFTRSYKSYEKTCLIPLADMANHSATPNTYQFRLRRADPQRYMIMSSRAIDKDEEITFSYGEFDNGFLWLLYGFCLKGNPFSRAGLPWTVLIDYMLEETLISASTVEFLQKTMMRGNALAPVVYVNVKGEVCAGFRNNVQVLLSMADTLTGKSATSPRQIAALELRVTEAIGQILMRFRSFLDGKAVTVSEEKKFLWLDDLFCVDTALKKLNR